MSSRNEFPTPEEIQADRIKTLWEYCPSAVPYITYAQKQGEPIQERLFNWREGFQHVLNMLIALKTTPDASAPTVPRDVVDLSNILAAANKGLPIIEHESGAVFVQKAVALAAMAKVAAPIVPEGWQLVPIEPDERMIRAGDVFNAPGNIYKAMLAVAPRVPRNGHDREGLLVDQAPTFWTTPVVDGVRYRVCQLIFKTNEVAIEYVKREMPDRLDEALSVWNAAAPAQKGGES